MAFNSYNFYSFHNTNSHQLPVLPGNFQPIKEIQIYMTDFLQSGEKHTVRVITILTKQQLSSNDVYLLQLTNR